MDARRIAVAAGVVYVVAVGLVAATAAAHAEVALATEAAELALP